MRTLSVFNHISLDGYFSGAGGDFSWAHKDSDDPEFSAYVQGNASGSGVLVFGRRTYELMAGYWPTPLAQQQNPAVADYMNSRPKIVVSHRQDGVDWANTSRLCGDIAAQFQALKQQPGPGLVILGSGSLVAQLAPAGVIDSYQLLVNPVALGGGRTLFDGIAAPLNLRLSSCRAFRNGKVLLCYGQDR